ncbi:FHA domain-containing protein [Flaviaesturariibacter aridisoli]|nr:FHA domain-containing protein [Flaviaesturariibacter aridisoli]
MGLFDRFKNDSTDAKSIRADLLYALRTRLSAFQGNEAGGLRSITLFLAPDDTLRAAYEAAIQAHEPKRFRAEVERQAEDYHLELPAGWDLRTEFCAALPAEATPVEGHPAGIWIAAGRRSAPAVQKARLRVLCGVAEQADYPLQPGGERITIGRERQVQLPDGFVRINTVAFLGDSPEEANRFVSRQHAHIRYDAALGQYLLFADAGGLPPHNKTKVKGRGEEVAVKLQSAEVPHQLRDGDQIMLGTSALLEFNTEQNSVHG